MAATAEFLSFESCPDKCSPTLPSSSTLKGVTQVFCKICKTFRHSPSLLLKSILKKWTVCPLFPSCQALLFIVSGSGESEGVKSFQSTSMALQPVFPPTSGLLGSIIPGSHGSGRGEKGIKWERKICSMWSYKSFKKKKNSSEEETTWFYLWSVFSFRPAHNQALPECSLKLREQVFLLSTSSLNPTSERCWWVRRQWEKGQKGLLPGCQNPLTGFTIHLPTPGGTWWITSIYLSNRIGLQNLWAICSRQCFVQIDTLSMQRSGTFHEYLSKCSLVSQHID